MDSDACPAPANSLPDGYRSLWEAAKLFLKVFPHRIVRLEQRSWKPIDYVSSAAGFISREIAIYGWNACSRVFEPIVTSDMYVFSEDLMRAEHCVWPTASDGTYTDLAVNTAELDAYLQKEIEWKRTRSYPVMLRPGTFDDDECWDMARKTVVGSE